MNYKESNKILLLMIILSCPFFISAQIVKEFDTTVSNMDNQLKKVFYGDIIPLKAGEQFLLDSVVSYIFFTPFDSLLNKREEFTYLPDGKIESYIKDTLQNPYQPFDFLYWHEEGHYSYNSDGKLILFKYGYGEEEYIYDEEGKLLEYRNTSGSDEKLEYYDYYQDGIIKHMNGSMKSCIYMTNTGCLQWDAPDTYEVFYNSEGLPDSAYETIYVPRFLEYDYVFNEENKLIYYEVRSYNTMRILGSKVIVTESDTFQNAIVNRSKTIFYDGNIVTMEFERTSISEFDENGNRVKGWWYNYNFDTRKLVLEVIDSLIYNENNQLKEIYTFGYGGGFKGDIHLTTFDYDQYGNLERKWRYNRCYLDQLTLYMKEQYFHSATGSTLPVGTISLTTSGMNVFPNPAHDYVWVTLPDRSLSGVEGPDERTQYRSLSGVEGPMVESTQEGFLYEIYDISGSLIKSGISDNNSAIDISGFKDGVYLLWLRGRSGEVLGYRKIIKI